MARVTGAQNRRRSTKKLFKRAKGFFLARKNTRRQATEAVLHARVNAFIGRKQRKREFRQLWIARISAAVAMHDLSYSHFIHGLDKAGVLVNRKMLSELAIHDTKAFEALVAVAKSNL